LNIAEGSLEECRYYLILAADLGYGQTESLTELADEVSRLLNAYARAILASPPPYHEGISRAEALPSYS
jgi:four helix bundle protein